MSEPVDETTPASPRTLARLTIGALAAAGVVLVCFVLPAEYGIDPTGVGRATGIVRLAGAQQISGQTAEAGTQTPVGAAARFYPGAFRSDFVEIPLNAGGTRGGGDELEYKVRMKAGSTLIYSWTVEGVSNPEEFYFDFHGEAPATEQGQRPTVVDYHRATGLSSHGALTAPMDGIFGWFLQNQSEAPAVVHLKLAGFHELIPAGENGNRASIEANRTLEPRARLQNEGPARDKVMD